MAPQTRTSLWAALLGVASLAILLSAFSWRFMPVQSDEATVAWAGKQTALGRVPYADFFSFLPPLTVYGLGAFFKAFGASIGALRVLSIFWLTAMTLLYFAMLRRLGQGDGLAAALAFCIPSLIVPVWPVSSHHWLAAGFGLAALWTALDTYERGAPSGWALSGALCALTLLTLQTDGLFFAFACGLLLLLSPHSRRNRRCLLAWLGGLLAPLSVTTAVLAIQGNLSLMIHDVLVWPARYYKQSGGFNDVSLVRSVGETFGRTLPFSAHPTEILVFLASCATGALVVAPLASLAWSPRWLRARRRPSRIWAWIAACMLVMGALYLSGRPDWTHLVFWSPIALFLAAREINWKHERLRPRIAAVVIVIVASVGAFRWALTWTSAPPLLSGALDVDREVMAHSYPLVVRMVPRIAKELAPVLCLPDGASLYFYWAPLPPPVDLILPVSDRANAPLDYGYFVAFARRERIPYILIRHSQTAAFLSEPSSIATLLRQDYHLAAALPLGDLFERNDHAFQRP